MSLKKIKKPKEKGFTIKSLIISNSIALKSNKIIYIFYILVSLLLTVNTFISLWSTQYTMTSAYNLFIKAAEFTPVLIGLCTFAIAQLVFSLIGIVNNILWNRLKVDMSFYFENKLNKKLSNIEWDYYESNKTYVKINEVRTNSIEKIEGFVDITVKYIISIPKLIIYSYFVWQINSIAVIIFLVMIFLCGILSQRTLKKIDNLWDEAQPFNQKQKYFFNMCGDKTTHQEYKSKRLYEYTSDKWEDAYNKEYKIKLKIFKNHEIIMQIAQISLNIPYVFMMTYICYEIAMGKLEIGFLMMANNLLDQLRATLMDIYFSIANNRENSRFVKAYVDILNLKEAPINNKKVVQCNLSLKDIVYKYPQSEYKALNKASFSITQGEKITIVGVNGSGKTTCTNLLLSLTNNYSGLIIDKLTEEKIDLSNSVSCILQDFMQYQMTVKENIEIGFIEKQFTDDEIISILNKVGLKEAILSLEKGIYTPLGQLDNGIELSKGQWQKLAIARLLANPNSTMWVLDEPTAYLDPLAEIDVYNMIYSLAEDKTVLFISHRLGFAKKSDKIIVFNEGAIIEEGTHNELMNNNGTYSQMYNNQKSWYDK